MAIFVAGVDLGQAQDYTALVIIEASGAKRKVTADAIDAETGLPYTRDRLVEMMPLVQVDVRHIERPPLQTKYIAIAHIVRQRMLAMPRPRYLAVDKTGVGAPVIEMFSELSPIGITITGGDAVTMTDAQDYRVPKRDLVSPVQVLFQNHVIRIAHGLPNGDLLLRELQNFRAKISAGGHDTYEAWRENMHDDLVLALAIAIWTASQIISANALGQLGTPRREDPPSISPY